MKRFVWPFIGLIFIIVIGIYASQKPSKSIPAPKTGLSLTLYTTGQATTPQIPLWAALDSGDLKLSLNTKFWKGLPELEGLMLAGKGDLWIGHIDGFAKAASRGAPVQLVSVTGWKKFYILSQNPNIKTFDDFLAMPEEAAVDVAPPYTPVIPVLRAMENKGLPHLHYLPHQPKQLALSVIQGKANLVILPEPLVTVLLNKVPNLRIIASVEEEYGKMLGKPPMLPLAGIAINTNTAHQHPELLQKLRSALKAQEQRLINNPAYGVSVLPKSFEAFVSKDLAKKSMARDLIHVESGIEAKDAILEYLKIIAPKSHKTITLPEAFFGPTK